MMRTTPTHPSLQAGNTALITGGANGIGLAVAHYLLDLGLNIVIADRNEKQLGDAQNALKAQTDRKETVASLVCDVSTLEDWKSLAAFTTERFGDVSFLMNNAGTMLPAGKCWENPPVWRTLLETNLWGIIYGVQTFVPLMLEHAKPALVINTGSKQGLTRPPGNPAYNLSKAGIIAFTESLAHDLRETEGCRINAHLLIPGFTYTGMVSRFVPEKPKTAWTSEQVTDFMFTRLENGDFYILCPDNEVSRDMDERRVHWHTQDIIQNRPALSRWHPAYRTAFEKFMDE